jgi:outer membrane protein
LFSKWCHMTLVTVLLGSLATSASAEGLLQVYQQALLKDQAYLMAQATWHATEQAMPIARASLLPALSLSGYYHKFRASESSEKLTNDNFNYTASLSQKLFDYAAWEGLTEASYTVRAARATLAQAAQQVMINTLTDYLAVLSAMEQAEVTQEQLKYYRASYQQISEKYKVGMATQADLYAARAALDLEEAQALSDDHDVDVAIEALSVLTGVRYENFNEFGHLKLTPPLPADITQWQAQAVAHNFGLQAAFLMSEGAREAIAVAKAGRMPTLSLTGSYSRTSQHSASPTMSSVVDDPAPVNETLLSLTTNMPVYQGGAVTALIQQAYYNYQSALAAYGGLKRQIIADVRTEYLDVLYDIRAIEANRLAITSADSALNAAQESYKAGTETLTDVYEAVKDLASAKQGLINVRYAYLLDIAKLKQSVGSLKSSDIEDLAKMMQHPVPAVKGKLSHGHQKSS